LTGAVAFIIKTTQTAYQLKRNGVTVASISLADELVILLIFVNNKRFVNTVTMGKVLGQCFIVHVVYEND